MAKKGITPIIAIIVLLLITIALAGAAWTYLQGFLFSQISNTFQIPPNGAYCSGPTGEKTIKVYVMNTGYQSLLQSGDFIIAEVDGTPLTIDIKAGVEIDQQLADIIFETDCDASTAGVVPGDGIGCDSGPHEVRIGTSSSVALEQVNCV